VLQEQLDRLGHKLNLEASGRAELWQRCAAQEQELQASHEKLLMVTKSLKRAEQQLGRCLCLWLRSGHMHRLEALSPSQLQCGRRHCDHVVVILGAGLE
jgi:hypothetical protein